MLYSVLASHAVCATVTNTI